MTEIGHRERWVYITVVNDVKATDGVVAGAGGVVVSACSASQLVPFTC